MLFYNRYININMQGQRWSRGHKARGQGQSQEHKKISRPRADPLEAKAKDQGPRTQVFSKKKIFKNLFQAISTKKRPSKFFFRRKRSSKVFFSGDLYLWKPKKRSLQIFSKVSGFFQRNFNGSKIVLSSSRGQGDFRGPKASRPRT